MDNPIYVALSRQMILRRQMDIVANNIANADTAGFKVEQLVIKTDPKPLRDPAGGPRSINYVVDESLARDYAQGGLTTTGNPLDVAIEGDAFFTVNTARGPRYTRDGRFSLDSEGRLVTKQGDAVQGEGGDIVVDTTKGPISISDDGIISQATPQGTERVGKLGVVRFDDRTGLLKEGDGLYRNVSNVTPQPATDALIHQGQVEDSNVQPIVQMTDMLEITRAYERIAKMVDQTQDLDRQSIQRLGRVQS